MTLSRSPFRPVALAMAALALGVLTGCGSGLPKTYPVKGKVVYKDNQKPLTNGLIEFEPTADSGERASSSIEEDGSFTLNTTHTNYKETPGAIPGEYRVFVELPRREGPDEGGKRIAVPGTYKVEPKTNEFTITIERPRRGQ